MANRAMTLAAGMLVAVNASAASAWAGPPSAGAAGSAPVREQNLDANGSIRVHEQGTVMSQVTNFPLNADGSLKTAGSCSVTGTVAATQSGPWSVGLDPAASSSLTNIEVATSGLQYDGDGNLLVSLGGSGSPADPSVADRTPFGLSFATGINAGESFTLNAASPARVASYYFRATEGTITVLFMQNDSPTFGFPLTTGQSSTAALAHAILADALRIECQAGGSNCVVFYSVAGY